MNLIYLIFLIPLISFLLLILSQGRWSKNINTIIGVGGIGTVFFITIYIEYIFYNLCKKDIFFIKKKLFNWINLYNLNVSATVLIDDLSLTLLFTVTFIGLLTQIYASWYMKNKIGYYKYYAYINLFFLGMLILILADNLLLMYFGWEIIGICSYLLINFYYRNKKNNIAAIKSFLMTKISDIILLIAICMIYKKFKTLNFSMLTLIINKNYVLYPDLEINLIALFIFLGTLGKSAQIPLQSWLPKAMLGPTPVSALMHSSTIVASGIYLISRTKYIFIYTPKILLIITISGIITALFSGISALIHNDLKQILAYSTISQIGYIFFSLGLQAWYAAIFHLVMHAFSKSLLFLSSGTIIKYRKEQNIYKINNSFKSMPFIYSCFIIGALSLAAFPIFTSGFYSKEMIIFHVLNKGNKILFILNLLINLITCMYIFRLIYLLFHKLNTVNIFNKIDYKYNHNVPLLILTLASTFLGLFIPLPINFIFVKDRTINFFIKILFIIINFLTFLLSGTIVYIFYNLNIKYIKNIYNNILFKLLNKYFLCSYGIDFLYKIIFINIFILISKKICNDPLNGLNKFILLILNFLKNKLMYLENGKLSFYISIIFISLFIIFNITILKF